MSDGTDATGATVADRAPHGTHFVVHGRIRAGTLILIRWLAVGGQAITLIFVHFGLGFALPIGACLAGVGASAALNIAANLSSRFSERLSDRETAMFIGYDILQLSYLLYLTGGVLNPFALLILAPVTVAATTLSRARTIAIWVLAIASVIALSIWHLPLPWSDGDLALPSTYHAGIGTALALAASMVAGYGWSVAEEGRRMSNALAATQMALDREHRVASLGALAAATAHELGSPLGTIALVAKELARDLPPDNPLADDIRLLVSQSARCREILQRLSARPDRPDSSPFDRLALPLALERAAEIHLDPLKKIELTRDGRSDGAAPTVPMRPELLHGLGNLLQNAIQFAASAVTVTYGWSPSEVTVSIADDGPGFSTTTLSRLGEPYHSERAEPGEHLGLGIFIAKTLLERTGATLSFENRPERGARVGIRWPRGRLENLGPG